MLDFNLPEMAVVLVVALLVIGPKDLPKAMRVAGYWVGRARGVARQFRSGFDEMVREAEIAEMEKRWKEENERIMREHPMLPAAAAAADPPAGEAGPVADDPAPVMVERPVVAPAEGNAPDPAPGPSVDGRAPS